MPLETDFPEHANVGIAGDTSERDQFAQTDSKYTNTPYTVMANFDDVMVRGMVVDENNHALNNAKVEFWDPWRGKLKYATSTGDNGEWFLRVPSDQYYIAYYKDDLYDEVGIVTVITQTDRVQEMETMQLNFDPPEFRVTPTEKYYVRCERVFLGDNDPNAYLLNDPKFLYSDDALIICTHLALNDFNAFPPRTNFALNELHPSWRTIIVMGAATFALIGRGLLENQNHLQYTDAGLNLSFARMTHLQSMYTAIVEKYNTARTICKANYKMAPHVLSRSVPFRLRSMAPRMWRLR